MVDIGFPEKAVLAELFASVARGHEMVEELRNEIQNRCPRALALTLGQALDVGVAHKPRSPDAEDLLLYLMRSRIGLPDAALRSVGDWLLLAVGDEDGDVQRAAQRVLAASGLLPIWEPGPGGVREVIWLGVANCHPGLAKIFAGTPWGQVRGQTRGWPLVLRRLPGTVVSSRARWFGEHRSRCTLVPVEYCSGVDRNEPAQAGRRHGELGHGGSARATGDV